MLTKNSGKLSIKKVFISTVIIVMFAQNLLSQEANNYSIGINIFNSFTFWEHQTHKGNFDNLGIGTFISPTYKMNFDNFYFQFGFMLSCFNFTGPDGLTTTTSADDVDYGFDSQMNRNDISMQIGYTISDYFRLDFQTNYVNLFINGDSKHKINNQIPFSYMEKGFLFGPRLNFNYPENNSKSCFTFSIYYLLGNLDYTYKSHNPPLTREPIKDNIDVHLFSANFGYKFLINSKWLLGFSLESDYFSKTKYDDIHTNSSDLWFLGVDTSIFYYLK